MPVESIPFTPSGNISAIAFDDDSQTLYVRFRRGHVYRYPGITGDIANGFAQSLSANDYLRQFVTPLSAGELVPADDPAAAF